MIEKLINNTLFSINYVVGRGGEEVFVRKDSLFFETLGATVRCIIFGN